MNLVVLQLILNKVLMLGSKAQTIIGRPILPDASVHAVVEEHVSTTIHLHFFLGVIWAVVMVSCWGDYVWTPVFAGIGCQSHYI